MSEGPPRWAPEDLTAGPLVLRIRLAGIAAAVFAAVAVHFAGLFANIDLTVATSEGTSGFGFGPVMLVALVAGLAGWAAAEGSARLTERPRRNWTVLALIVLMMSFVPLFGFPRETAVLLAVEHLTVATVLSLAFRLTLPERR